MHGLHRRVTGRLGCGSCLLTGDPRALPDFPEALPLFPDCLERLTVLVADLPRFLGQPPELFRLIPARLGGNAVSFGQPTVLLCVLTTVLGLLAHALGVLPVLLWRGVIVWHVASAHRSVDQSCRTTLRRGLLTLRPPLYSMSPSFLNLFKIG